MDLTEVLLIRIQAAVDMRNTNVTTVLRECGINTSMVSDLKSKGSIPSADKINKIADYLNVSVDYLLGRTDKPNMAVIDLDDLPIKLKKAFDQEEVEILEVAKEAAAEGLTAADFREILKTLKVLKKSEKKG